MRIYLNNMLSMNFPMTAFELQDALDRLGVPQDKPIVRFRILKYDNMNLPQGLCGREFSTDIYKLNLFTERYEKLKFAEKAAMKSLLISNPESSFDEILLMTYGLNSVPV